jgi:hypothetical protein
MSVRRRGSESRVRRWLVVDGIEIRSVCDKEEGLARTGWSSEGDKRMGKKEKRRRKS